LTPKGVDGGRDGVWRNQYTLLCAKRKSGGTEKKERKTSEIVYEDVKTSVLRSAAKSPKRGTLIRQRKSRGSRVEEERKKKRPGPTTQEDGKADREG